MDTEQISGEQEETTLAQDEAADEVVAADDGSTDPSSDGGTDASEKTGETGTMREKSKLVSVIEWVVLAILAMLCSVLIRRFLVDVYIIPTESMTTTILPGDRMIGEKVTLYFSEPERGQVVTFENPLEGESTTLVKRCVAVAGDEVDLINGALYVNGEFQDEPYVLGRPSYPLIEADGIGPISYPYVVPEGTIWVMGDNRTNSNDSRYFGPVPLENVAAKALCIFWPVDHAHGL